MGGKFTQSSLKQLFKMMISLILLLTLHHHSHPIIRLSALELQAMLLSSDVHSHPLLAEEITPVFYYGFHNIFDWHMQLQKWFNHSKED